MSFYKLLIVVFLLFFMACKDETSKPTKDVSFSKDDSAEMNKQLNKEINFMINDYIKRNGWQVATTETGIRYMIYENGNGLKAEAGLVALIEFDIYLLDGKKCYSSKDEGLKSFKIESSDVESGLHEAVQNMRVGDRAKVILPHFRAHGLIGDSDKIPPLSPIIYDVHLMALSPY
jgi:FKBP-type peptidyl-prolyl cis-trans isomerase FkpA